MWGATISKGIFGSDQRAIEYAVNQVAHRWPWARVAAASLNRGAQLNQSSRVAFMDINEDTRFFTFINGTVCQRMLPYTFVHTTFYRLLNGRRRRLARNVRAR